MRVNKTPDDNTHQVSARLLALLYVLVRLQVWRTASEPENDKVLCTGIHLAGRVVWPYTQSPTVESDKVGDEVSHGGGVLRGALLDAPATPLVLVLAGSSSPASAATPQRIVSTLPTNNCKCSVLIMRPNQQL